MRFSQDLKLPAVFDIFRKLLPKLNCIAYKAALPHFIWTASFTNIYNAVIQDVIGMAGTCQIDRFKHRAPFS